MAENTPDPYAILDVLQNNIRMTTKIILRLLRSLLKSQINQLNNYSLSFFKGLQKSSLR